MSAVVEAITDRQILTNPPFEPLDVQCLRVLLREATKKARAMNWGGMMVGEICERLGVVGTIKNRGLVLAALRELERKKVAYHLSGDRAMKSGRWFPSTKVVVYAGFCMLEG